MRIQSYKTTKSSSVRSYLQIVFTFLLHLYIYQIITKISRRNVESLDLIVSLSSDYLSSFTLYYRVK